MAPRFDDFHRRSIEERDAFWAEQARRIDWHVPPQRICDYDNPPFARWFVGGQTNLCHNAVDRHLDRKSTRLNSSHSQISYAVFCLKKKKTSNRTAVVR